MASGLLGLLATTAAVVQDDPHPWIADLVRDLRDIAEDVRRGDLDMAEGRGGILVETVQASIPAWKQELENVQERSLILDFEKAVRNVPAAIHRRNPRRIADALGRCHFILSELRLVHEDVR